ncbi:MAG TPA: NUDIX domain-containing protein [Actinomycetota bacterium]|nr:NUDIX domain-containing protein [Actinomycetota bacterium]
MRTRTVVSAGGVIIDDEGRVVLTSRRTFGGDLQWGLPKGQVEPGEAIADAARREATEETGLEVEIVSRLTTIDYWYIDKARSERVHKFVHYFLMRATGGDPTAHDAETEEVAALEPGEAANRASFKSERAVIRAAAAGAAAASPKPPGMFGPRG